MALEPLDIEITFMEPPPEENEDDESDWPRVMVDISGVETIIQPLVLRMLSLVREKSIERGAKYYFFTR